MSEKRYFKIEYDEEWYLFDSTTISEQLVKEQAEYGYGVFANSLSPSEIVGLLNEQQDTIKQLESDKAIAEDYANIFEKENVKLRKKLNKYKATVLGFIWMMEQNGRISGKDDKVVKDLFKELENE